MTITLGFALAILGAVLAIGLAGIGSILGISRISAAASGLLSKEPKFFVKVLVFLFLPTSQAIYGFTVAFLILNSLGVLAGTPAPLTTDAGLAFLLLGLPVGILGGVSATLQGAVGVTAVNLIGKQEKLFVQGIIIISGSELIALFGFLVSLLGVMFLPVTGATVDPAADALRFFVGAVM